MITPPSRSSQRFQFLLPRLLLLVGLCITGCGGGLNTDYGKLDLASVTGTVKLDGQPLAGVMVKFEDEEQRFSSGITDSAGHYRLMFNSEKSGVLPGAKIVRFSSAAAADPEAASEEDNPERPAPKEIIPACYNKESKIAVAVKSGSQSFDFDLKADCSTTGSL